MQNAVTGLVIVLVVLLALTLIGGAGMMGFGGFGMGPGMMGGGGMMGGYGGYGYAFDPLGTILSLVFWALIIGGVALLVVYLVRNAKVPSASGESPLDIVKARYARGEINKEQLDALKRDLGA
jgi:putative membrane protein